MIRYAIGLVAALALLFGAFMFGHHVEHQARVAEVSTLQAGYAKSLAEANQQRADAEQAARDTEAKRVADMAALDANYQKELSDAKTVSDRTIADLQSGNVRLRERFTCNAGSGGVPSTAQAGTRTSSADAASPGGLRQADADFLVRLADRADQCAIQVKALQDVVRKDRDAQ
ncbi:Rz-like spanin [Burkholderia phage Mica]|uniref:I-spanin n=1 Tax=Burkholderia phage Mica TaxID=2767579 RepID=A0A873WBS2_9CAUD|nr:Rz-like spanin [Burkholderia phage Mica]QPB08680.1 i-spanin [Burkholderia phage Mica]